MNGWKEMTLWNLVFMAHNWIKYGNIKWNIFPNTKKYGSKSKHFTHVETKRDELVHIDGLVQDCSISSALAKDILQSCTKLLI